MKVLVACEESQEVCKAFREKGHEAYSCDLQQCSGGHPEWHINDDCLKILRGGCRFKTQDGRIHSIKDRWDLIIAHPPCTYLSNAGACRLYPSKGNLDYKRYSDGLNGKIFFMHFWLYGWYNIGKICIENPLPSGVYQMPKHTQVIQPYQFGEPYSKRTHLWLFGLPALLPTEIIEDHKPYLPSGTGRKLRGESYGVARGSVERSKTFRGIAKAMAEQWG